MKHVLFLCGRNRLRSPTAEAVFASRADLEVMSAGLDDDAEIVCAPEMVESADIIFVMERSHRTKLKQRFKKFLRNARVICLDIPDNYQFMQPELVQILNARVDRHLPRGTGDR